jgi:flagellar biosynthesis chaperone FliJ
MSGVDLRGFPWTLAAAERVRQHAADGAASRLAQAEQARRELQSDLEAMEHARQEQLRFLTGGSSSLVDPARQQHALRYLTQALGQERQRREQQAQLGARVELAKQECVDAQRRLESLRKLREAALARHAQDQLRRQAREADLAWLARRPSRSEGSV